MNKFSEMGRQGLGELLTLFFIIEVMKILEAIHELGVIHADIKPDNFLVKTM